MHSSSLRVVRINNDRLTLQLELCYLNFRLVLWDRNLFFQKIFRLLSFPWELTITLCCWTLWVCRRIHVAWWHVRMIYCVIQHGVVVLFHVLVEFSLISGLEKVSIFFNGVLKHFLNFYWWSKRSSRSLCIPCFLRRFSYKVHKF